eukprot:CAMPEP_0185038264 /NCGR_PEP_ID=MMETSP1103-20130426/33697_1 /TAXON_ID=36769 /ORGANISM="Paraphysomonas bandaiensis, Strain Caron Lab Isolate" /LENGTH=279 /DNA_ID=CAMNT_0027576617 /DNA_START=109 /DNA_END=948 /DNA_ORIENTATION=+
MRTTSSQVSDNWLQQVGLSSQFFETSPPVPVVSNVQPCRAPPPEICVRSDDPWTLSVRPVVMPNNRVYLMPCSNSGNMILMQALRDSATLSRVTGLPEGVLRVDVLPSHVDVTPPLYQAAPTPLAEVQLAPKLQSPKYISQTSIHSFRVQVSAGIKSARNKKFSRNVGNMEDALWLCEYALILTGNHSSLNEIVGRGNYYCFVQRELVRSISDFGSKLHENLQRFYDSTILTKDEHSTIKRKLSACVPDSSDTSEDLNTFLKDQDSTTVENLSRQKSHS